MKTIALVKMADSGDDFYVEDPPKGCPSKWIEKFVYNIEDVEYVDVYEVGDALVYWSNPNCSPESD